MSSLKNLAGQTVWYGLSNIAAKLLNYLLTPLLTYILHTPKGQADYGDFSVLYAAISFANIVFTYGMETAYFRFASQGTDKDKLFQTTFGSLLVSTVLLSAVVYAFRGWLSDSLGVAGHPEYITFSVGIIAADTLAAIPFARLRHAGRPRRYALLRLLGISVTVILTVVFIWLSPDWVQEHPGSAYAIWYKGYTRPGLMLLANLAGSVATLLLLWKEWSDFRFHFDKELWQKIIAYSAPFIIIGLGGMVNETLDRIMLRNLLPVDVMAAKREVGIYSANYRIAIFITLFIQAFRMAAEPFFFNQSADKNAPKTYARVMKWFVITLCFAFLFTALFLDVWQYMVGKEYRRGLGVVPILLYANLALGIYYNLAVWYKVSGRLGWGIGITLIGAALTLSINYLLIPKYGMYACAWATAICYTSMMVLSYLAGQKFFPVPYQTKKLLSYVAVITVLFFVQRGVCGLTDSFVMRVLSGMVLMSVFLGLILKTEREELRKFPVIGKYL
jgi:O-antigen/teichoic acid export membrane protein